MKKLIETHVWPAPWAGLGLVLFLALGIGKAKCQEVRPVEVIQIQYSK
jgi:hypothetical protein